MTTQFATLKEIEARRKRAEHDRRCAAFAPFALNALLRGEEKRRKRLTPEYLALAEILLAHMAERERTGRCGRRDEGMPACAPTEPSLTVS